MYCCTNVCIHVAWNALKHINPVRHSVPMCRKNFIINGPSNVTSHTRCQAFTWTNDDLTSAKIPQKIRMFSVKKTHLKISETWRPFCPGLIEVMRLDTTLRMYFTSWQSDGNMDGELHHHWFRYAYIVPSHYLSQCWFLNILWINSQQKFCQNSEVFFQGIIVEVLACTVGDISTMTSYDLETLSRLLAPSTKGR